MYLYSLKVGSFDYSNMNLDLGHLHLGNLHLVMGIFMVIALIKRYSPFCYSCHDGGLRSFIRLRKYLPIP